MSSGRALRADARSNLEAIVEAAKAVFSERGLGVPLEEIAAAANVGIATLYRRFPKKLDLIQAAFQPELVDYLALIERGIAKEDAWKGFEESIMGIGEMQAANRALADVLAITPSLDPDLNEVSRYGSDLITQLVDRAKVAGELRLDFEPQDVVLIGLAMAGVIHSSSADDPDGWRRILRYCIEGLRSNTATGSSQERVV